MRMLKNNGRMVCPGLGQVLLGGVTRHVGLYLGVRIGTGTPGVPAVCGSCWRHTRRWVGVERWNSVKTAKEFKQ